MTSVVISVFNIANFNSCRMFLYNYVLCMVKFQWAELTQISWLPNKLENLHNCIHAHSTEFVHIVDNSRSLGWIILAMILVIVQLLAFSIE